VLIVILSEMAVDWLKHAFITKFNHIRVSDHAGGLVNLAHRENGIQEALSPDKTLGQKGQVGSSEMAVDWLKHAFITKFNHIRASVYDRYLDVLCKDAGGLVNLAHRENGIQEALSPDKTLGQKGQVGSRHFNHIPDGNDRQHETQLAAVQPFSKSLKKKIFYRSCVPVSSPVQRQCRI
jgi:predicted metal-dependent phosphoesterase TrpH